MRKGWRELRYVLKSGAHCRQRYVSSDNLRSAWLVHSTNRNERTDSTQEAERIELARVQESVEETSRRRFCKKRRSASLPTNDNASRYAAAASSRRPNRRSRSARAA